MGNQKGRGKGTPPTLPPSEESGPPRSFAETPPPAYSRTIEGASIFEALMQIQGTVGELKNGVAHLTGEVKEHGRKISRMSHVLFAGEVIGGALLAAAAFLIVKYWDAIVHIFTTTPTSPAG